jgi:hypothetical protein
MGCHPSKFDKKPKIKPTGLKVGFENGKVNFKAFFFETILRQYGVSIALLLDRLT